MKKYRSKKEFTHLFSTYGSNNVCVYIYLKYLFIWLHQVWVAEYRIFSYGMWDLVTWLGIKPWAPVLEAQSPNHWTTREVPIMYILA